MSKPCIHMDVITEENDDEIFCGIQGMNVSVTLEWKLVTCKRCLKARGRKPV